MISVLVAATMAQSALRVAEAPDAAAKSVWLSAVVRTDDATVAEQRALVRLAPMLEFGSTEYGPSDLAGRIRTSWNGDLLRIDLRADTVEDAAQQLASILTKPALLADDLAKTETWLKSRFSDPWSSLVARAPQPGTTTLAEIIKAHRRFFVRERFAFGATGRFQPGDVALSLAGQSFASRPGLERSSGPAPSPKHVREWRTPPAPITALRFAAVCALGAGKGSSMFRAWRDQHAWSYRQEAMFWPTAHGPVVRLLAATDGTTAIDPMHAALVQDVSAWGAQHLERAISVARLSLTTGHEFGPLWLDASGPAQPSPQGEAAWLAVQKIAGQEPVTRRNLADGLDQITLEQLKQESTRLLESAKPF